MTNTRRDFFRLAALPVTWKAFQTALQAAAPGMPDATNETYWSMVKRQFPLDEKLIYLNAANVCPSSRLVLDRLGQAVAKGGVSIIAAKSAIGVE